jgi:hypothetical protein
MRAPRSSLRQRRRADPAGPYGEGLAAERGIVALLDRRVKRVHVHVKDPTHGM